MSNIFTPLRGRIQEFSSGGGGGQVSLKKKVLTTFLFCFFSTQLILQKSNGQFKKNLSFFEVPEGVQLFPGRGGGSNCLFPIETHISCDFPAGGGGDPCPPIWIRICFTFYIELCTKYVVVGVNLGLLLSPLIFYYARGTLASCKGTLAICKGYISFMQGVH